MRQVKRVVDSSARPFVVILLLWRLFEARVAWLRIQIPRESARIFGARDGAPTADLPRREQRAVPPSNDPPLPAYHLLCPGPQTKFVDSSSQTPRDSGHAIMPNQRKQVTPVQHQSELQTTLSTVLQSSSAVTSNKKAIIVDPGHANLMNFDVRP